MIDKIKNEIKSEYKYRIEMHAHTKPVSSCSEILPEEMAETYYKLGYDAVVITNHFIEGMFGDVSKEEFLNKYLDAYEETKANGEKYNLKVFLGAEIRFAENVNDYLIFGVDRDVLSICYDYLGKDLSMFRKEVLLDKSVFVQAHPFRDKMTVVDEAFLDGYEIFNMHPGHNSRNAFAVRTAKKNGNKILTVGSDFHHKNRGHEGISALRTRNIPKDSFELADMLKSKDYVFEIWEDCIILP